MTRDGVCCLGGTIESLALLSLLCAWPRRALLARHRLLQARKCSLHMHWADCLYCGRQKLWSPVTTIHSTMRVHAKPRLNHPYLAELQSRNWEHLHPLYVAADALAALRHLHDRVGAGDQVPVPQPVAFVRPSCLVGGCSKPAQVMKVHAAGHACTSCPPAAAAGSSSPQCRAWFESPPAPKPGV